MPPTVQLQPGSTDVANIKKLQDYLVAQGLMTQAQVNTGYGIYGPQTTQAVAALQKKLGVDTSAGGAGYYGPLTSSAVTKGSGSTDSSQSAPTWNLSAWNSQGNKFTNQPVLTINGKQQTFNTPQEYINALQQLKSQGADTNRNIDQFIGEFNNIVPNFASTSQQPVQQVSATSTPTPNPAVTVTSNPVTNANPNPQSPAYNPFEQPTIPTTSTPTNNGGTVPTNTTDPAGNGGYNLGDGENLTQEEFDALNKSYYDEQSPFYDAQKSYEMSKYSNNDSQALRDYDLSQRDYAARAQEDFDTLNDNEGKNGTWASSERIKRRDNLQGKYNRSYESLYNKASDNLLSNRNDTAYQYGDNAITNNSPVQKYGATFGDTNITTNPLTSGGAYNPFGFQGRRNVERKQNSYLGAVNQLDTFNYKTKFKNNIQ